MATKQGSKKRRFWASVETLATAGGCDALDRLIEALTDQLDDLETVKAAADLMLVGAAGASEGQQGEAR